MDNGNPPWKNFPPAAGTSGIVGPNRRYRMDGTETHYRDPINAARTPAERVEHNVGLVHSAMWRVLRVGRNHPDHDEVKATGLLLLWRAARAWRPYGSAGFSHFATTVIARGLRYWKNINKRRGITLRGRRGNEVAVVPPFVSGYDVCHYPDPNDYDDVETCDTAARVEAVLAELPERVRTVVRLYYLEGHTYREIERNSGLGICHERARQLLAEGIGQLRARLVTPCPPEERAGVGERGCVWCSRRIPRDYRRPTLSYCPSCRETLKGIRNKKHVPEMS